MYVFCFDYIQKTEKFQLVYNKMGLRIDDDIICIIETFKFYNLIILYMGKNLNATSYQFGTREQRLLHIEKYLK